MARREKYLLGRWKGHGCAGIDKDVGEEIDLFAEQFYVQPVAASIDTPIEVAKIIPRRVSPVIGEFQTGAPPGGGVVPGVAAQELFSCPQPESFQLAEELRRKWLRQHLDSIKNRRKQSDRRARPP